jgi:hypothetical protein
MNVFVNVFPRRIQKVNGYDKLHRDWTVEIVDWLSWIIDKGFHVK